MSKIIKHIGELDRNLDKLALEDLAQQHASEIIANEQYDLLKVYLEFRRYETYLKTLTEAVKQETLNQAKEEGLTDFEYGSAKVTFVTRRKYDYSADRYWASINEEMDNFKTMKKEREQVLKNIEGEFEEIIDEETGEIQKVYAPIVEHIDSLRVTL